ncbi:MAG: DUF2075 domain-containing protein [Leptothrix sp. (in: b-proteobacteria)]
MTLIPTARLDRAYYSAAIQDFLSADVDQVLGRLTANSEFAVDLTQRDAWQQEVALLREVLLPYANHGRIHLEFVVPRLGKRIDAVLLMPQAIVVLEFKVGASSFLRQDVDQVWDYALDLKNFHEPSHAAVIVPVLVITGARNKKAIGHSRSHHDGVSEPTLVSSDQLSGALHELLGTGACESLSLDRWEQGRYLPTPTIVEAASALYRGHAVQDISRHEAGATNLAITSEAVAQVIEQSREHGWKSICLVTGVPGAGKTLVGLDVATRYRGGERGLRGVYLSGNGPLVSVLQEALVRDEVQRAKDQGRKRTKSDARQPVKSFIQAVHHFRDEYLKDAGAPPEHVAIFDEAQRAWNKEKTADFMHRKKGRPGFEMSEPAFLISCLDRHPDWAVVVCLIGGGQEINTGEGGITEWLRSLQDEHPDWRVHVSPRLTDSEYAAEAALDRLKSRANVAFDASLHLATSMRSFRADSVSGFVKQVLDLELQEAALTFRRFSEQYPIVLTRDVERARTWLRQQARGNERYGIVVSSQAQRLKPHAIDVRSPMDPVNWFLNERDDVRSSYYLEDVATEFHVQGLELDWSCVVWDADLRHSDGNWQHHSFVGNRWQHIRKGERKSYLKNAYRVLLTRARQGMVIVVPEGAAHDPTRQSAFYDGTFELLREVGLPVLA